MTDNNVDFEFLRRQMAKAQQTGGSPVVAGGGGDSHIPSMDERIGRLEGALEGLRHSQNLTVGIVSLVALLLVGFGVYGLQRLDTLSDKVAELPNKISSDLRDLTKTLAESINAAKQQQPQVILMPAPATQKQSGQKP